MTIISCISEGVVGGNMQTFTDTGLEAMENLLSQLYVAAVDICLVQLLV